MIYKNVFYFHSLNVIGGTETFFWNIAQKYKDHDITILYQRGDVRQVGRLRNLVRVVKWKGQEIECEKAFFCYTLDIIDHVHAQEKIQIIHADYRAIGIKANTNPQIDRYIGVSQTVCDSFKAQTGIECELCYNPVFIEKPKKVLRLVSATRLSREKGRERMARLADALEKAEIPFTWEVFTNDRNRIPSPNIVWREPRLDILPHIANADYLVQLSDTEGYSYSMIEALSVGTPVIVTKFPVAKEMGVVNGVNGFILPFDMKNIPVKEIYKGLRKFTYTAKEDRWSELLAAGERTYDPHGKVKVKAVRPYYDIQLGRHIEAGTEMEADRSRAETLGDANVSIILEDS